MTRTTPAPAAFLLLLALSIAACVPAPVGRPSDTATIEETREPTRAPSTPTGPTPIPTFRRPTPTPRPTFFSYRVHTGDTLTSIARQFETTTESLAYWNRVAYPSLDPESPDYDPNDIRVGWTLLLIPGKQVDPEDLPPGPSEPPTPMPSGSAGG